MYEVVPRPQTAHLFCKLGLRIEQAGLPLADYPMPLRQTQFADALGLTPVHINRTLQALKHDGLVSIIDKTIRVHDWEALARMAEFDPAFLLINPPAEREVA